jgi:16S rRNA A1518/A1519 N6-dimethyltransferase RsmA/KsgA/DIM1 with predicted DNA glycosylase/AP lyase activity
LEEALFFRLTTAAFAAKRKQIKNSFGSLLGPDASLRLKAAELSPESRPEEISLNQWVTLARTM